MQSACTKILLSCAASCTLVQTKDSLVAVAFAQRKINVSLVQFAKLLSNLSGPLHTAEQEPLEKVSIDSRETKEISFGRGIAENEPPECRLHEVTARTILPSFENEMPQTFRRMRQGSRQRMMKRRFQETVKSFPSHRKQMKKFFNILATSNKNQLPFNTQHKLGLSYHKMLSNRPLSSQGQYYINRTSHLLSNGFYSIPQATAKCIVS